MSWRGLQEGDRVYWIGSGDADDEPRPVNPALQDRGTVIEVGMLAVVVWDGDHAVDEVGRFNCAMRDQPAWAAPLPAAVPDVRDNPESWRDGVPLEAADRR